MSNSVCRKFLDTLTKLGLYKRPVIKYIYNGKPIVIANDVTYDVNDETK